MTTSLVTSINTSDNGSGRETALNNDGVSSNQRTTIAFPIASRPMSRARLVETLERALEIIDSDNLDDDCLFSSKNNTPDGPHPAPEKPVNEEAKSTPAVCPLTLHSSLQHTPLAYHTPDGVYQHTLFTFHPIP